MNGGGGVPDLAQAGRLVVIERRIIQANAIDIYPGGLTHPQAVAHLQAVDVLTQSANFYPLGRQQLQAIHKMAGELLDAQ